MVRLLALFALMSAVWFLWSGHTETMILGFGAASVLLVVWLTERMTTVDLEVHPYHLSWRPILYGPWLFKEIVLSNLHVVRVILSPGLPIRPQLVRIDVTQKTDMGQVLHANSITITPGTVSLDVRNGQILVHCLTDTTAEGVQSGEMDRRVTWLEGNG